MRERLGEIRALFRLAVRTWSGDEEYERYVECCAARQQRPLDRRRYFARRLEERYRTTARCC